MFWRKKKKEEDPEDWESFAKELVEQNRIYIDKLVDCYDQLKDVHQEMLEVQKTVRNLKYNNKLMLGMLKMYAKWDDHINGVINKNRKKGEQVKEGAATLYLKSIGEYHECDQGKTYGH